MAPINTRHLVDSCKFTNINEYETSPRRTLYSFTLTFALSTTVTEKKQLPQKKDGFKSIFTYHSIKEDRKLGEKSQSSQSINLFSILLSHNKHNSEFTHFKNGASKLELQKHEPFHIYRKLVKTARISWLLETLLLG